MNRATLLQKPFMLQFIIAAIAAMVFIPFLGGVHLFDWDEINFAESAREMILTKNYLTVQVNFLPFWEKPPLFIWMQVLSMKAFGINEFAARFPDAVCGIVSLLILFNIGRKLYDEKFGLIWVLMYGCSWLPFIYFKSGIIDPWFNLFIFTGIWFFIRYAFDLNQKAKTTRLLGFLTLSALFLGLAVLTKGPVAILVFTLAFGVYFLISKDRIPLKIAHILFFILVLACVGGFWFILQVLNGHASVVMDFIHYQVKLFSTKDAGHGGFLFYHFVVLLIGVFPASWLALPSLFRKTGETTFQLLFDRWMKILFWVVLILFTIVKTKIVHYSSLCYFPLTFMAASFVYQVLQKKARINNWLTGIIVFMAVLVAILTGMIPFIDDFKDVIIQKGWIKDAFAIGNLEANGGWSGWESLASLILLSGTFAFIWMRNSMRGILWLLLSSAIFAGSLALLYAPRIEKYSQAAAIEFYKQQSGKDVSINTLNFKSYATLFYFKKPVPDKPQPKMPEELLYGPLDKDAYFVIKNTQKQNILSRFPDLKVVSEKNGFVFLLRSKEVSLQENSRKK